MRGRPFITVLTALAAGAALTVSAVAATAATTPPDQWTSESAGAGHTNANVGESVITPTSASKLRAAWQTGNGASFVAPAVVGGVVYRAVNPDNADDHATFIAASARTGARLWSVTLPESQYYRGQSVVNGIAVLPFEGWHKLAGVTAVNLSTHKVLWSRSRPPSANGNNDGTGGPVAVDSGRVYLLAGDDDLSAYDLQTGTLLWHHDPAYYVQAIAAGGGRLYTGGSYSGAGPGLIAYDGATGRQQWTAGLYGQPVVVGSLVLADYGTGVGAVSAAGCGAGTCKRIWTRTFGAEPESIAIGAATASSFYVAYTTTSNNTGRLMRIATGSGAPQWTYANPESFGDAPIRAGGTVWIQTALHTVKGWSVAATGTGALKTITLPSADNGVGGGLADANGSLLVDIFAGALTAYRVPGS